VRASDSRGLEERVDIFELRVASSVLRDGICAEEVATVAKSARREEMAVCKEGNCSWTSCSKEENLERGVMS